MTANVRATLEPGGWYVISDFPFPDTDEALRAPAGRVTCGIQFFEAQIDDQLLPGSTTNCCAGTASPISERPR